MEDQTSMNGESRRTFLGQASLAVPVAAVFGGAVGAATVAESTGKRRVVPGSPSPAFSRAVVFGGLVYASGVVGRKPGADTPISEDFETQCRQALKNLKASVEAAGSSMAKALKCTCFLTDVADFPTFNKVYVTFFPSDPPARSTVVVKELVVSGAKLEIDCVASLDA
jgi:2-iminobutanoate/2-iminopropanoate deaminase